jgi:catechol 2,3-dioxygenase-like lactoylglutathione lyase family enzyme
MDSLKYQVSYIRIGTHDPKVARQFYEETLGLSLISHNIEEGYLLLSLSGITLIVEKTDPEKNEEELRPGRYLGISLKVKDIFDVYERLSKEGVIFSHPPEKQFWGGHLTEFQDPDGNTWTLLA